MWNIKLDLSLSSAPRPGENAELTCLVLCNKDTENITVRVDLPPGIEFIKGHVIWGGSMKAGNKIELKSTIKACSEGVCEIKAVAVLDTYKILLDVEHLYLNISPTATTVSLVPISKPSATK